MALFLCLLAVAGVASAQVSDVSGPSMMRRHKSSQIHLGPGGEMKDFRMEGRQNRPQASLFQFKQPPGTGEAPWCNQFFPLGTANKNNCLAGHKRITTMEDCRHAAKKLGYNISTLDFQTNDYSQNPAPFPKDCFVDANDFAHFNPTDSCLCASKDANGDPDAAHDPNCQHVSGKDVTNKQDSAAGDLQGEKDATAQGAAEKAKLTTGGGGLLATGTDPAAAGTTKIENDPDCDLQGTPICMIEIYKAVNKLKIDPDTGKVTNSPLDSADVAVDMSGSGGLLGYCEDPYEVITSPDECDWAHDCALGSSECTVVGNEPDAGTMECDNKAPYGCYKDNIGCSGFNACQEDEGCAIPASCPAKKDHDVRKSGKRNVAGTEPFCRLKDAPVFDKSKMDEIRAAHAKQMEDAQADVAAAAAAGGSATKTCASLDATTCTAPATVADATKICAQAACTPLECCA